MPPPERWDNYTPVGNVIEGTRIVCFKVPLKKALIQNVPDKDKFTPENLVQRLVKMGLKLGLVIDLTFTRKYYNSSDLTRQNIKYEKVFTEGHNVPSNEVYGRFACVVDEYLEENKDNDSVIGVHCTHGVNRTGYLVCRYMIERLNLSPDDALRAFNTARGHEVERKNYISDLQTRIPGQKTPFDQPIAMKDGKPMKVENSYSKLLEEHTSYGHRHSLKRFRGHKDQGNHNNSNRSGAYPDHQLNNGGHHGNEHGYDGNQDWNDYGSWDRQWAENRGNRHGYYGNQDRRGYGGNGSLDRQWVRDGSFNQADYHGNGHGYYGNQDRRGYRGNGSLDRQWTRNGNLNQADYGYFSGKRDSSLDCHYGQRQSRDYARSNSYGSNRERYDQYQSPKRYSDWSDDDSSGFGLGAGGANWGGRTSRGFGKRGRR